MGYTQTMNLVLAFSLIVIVEGQPIPGSGTWLFANAYRCNEAARAVEWGHVSPKGKRYLNENVTAYCVPKSVQKGTSLFY
jgi:hypothetical protein